MDVEAMGRVVRTARLTRAREDRLREAVADRDEAIREAVAAGWSRAEVARRCGLSRERVQQITEHRR